MIHPIFSPRRPHLISEMYPKKIITVKQPWAWAIIHAGKDIENRTWRTKFRGRLFIHSSLTWDKFGWEWLEANMPHKIPMKRGLIQTFDSVIGVVDVVDCVDESKSKWFMGPYGFVLKDPKPCRPHHVIGKLGITNAESDLIKKYWEGDLDINE